MKKEMVTGLNNYLSDLAVLHIKFHNLHWNVTGKQFVSIHEYLETQYDKCADYLDAVAEMLKINGETPLASLKEYLAATSIEELESVELPVEKVLEIVTADIKKMNVSAYALRKEADEDGLFTLVGMFEDHIGAYEKDLWFLSAMVK